jgi:hypothetical protein
MSNRFKEAGSGAIDAALMLGMSIASGVIISFFFVSVFLKDVAAFAMEDSLMFVAPLCVGFLYGLMIADKEIHYVLFSTIMITASAVAFIYAALFSPQLLGTGVMLPELSGWAFKDMMLAGIVTFPLILTSSVIGKFVGETTFHSMSLKQEREALKRETLEWYAMLEKVEGDKLRDDLEAPEEWLKRGGGEKGQ